MKRILAILGAAAFAVMTLATVVSFAQQSTVVVKQRVEQSHDGVPVPPDKDFIFVASEVNFGGKVVKGAPYSAEAVTETTQTLGDGNRIINKTTSMQYRDGEGRTRREQTIKMLGPLAGGGEPLQTIFINDPVAGVTYSLDSRTHVARKSMPMKGTLFNSAGAGGGAQTFEFKIEGPPSGGAMMKLPLDGPPPAGPGAPDLPRQLKVERELAATGSAYTFHLRKDDENAVKEQLGKQSFDGIEAEGTRTTITIPAGEIGNEREIQIISERWYSPELQLVVMTRHSDPRNGETIYRLTNINRAEPDKTLFEVPGGFTIKEGFGGVVAPMGLPAKVRKPE